MVFGCGREDRRLLGVGRRFKYQIKIDTLPINAHYRIPSSLLSTRQLKRDIKFFR